MSFRTSPIIIIGMHRSGTSMITRLLEELGLFAGEKKNTNDEAVFFHKINEWLITQSGGEWDHPEPVRKLIANEEIRGLATDYISRYLIKSPRTITFLGWRKYLRYKTPLNLDVPWGWKSPLNTYTLPLWLDLFPEAKILHIYRHGVDVAHSLRARGRREMQRTPLQRLYYELKFVHWLWPKPGEFIGSVRCDSLEGGLSLWEEYISEARAHARLLNGRAIELKYEDFLSEPERTLGELARFCDLSANDAAINTVASRVKKERAYAYRGNPELRAFATRVSQRLAAQNY
jgi:hypothetical protein